MERLFTFLSLLLFTRTLNAQNNVGIGTNTPTYPLTVEAIASKGITQRSGSVELGFFTSNTGAFVQTWSNHNLNFATNNSSAQITLTTSGNVGIGTSTPSTKLDVNGTVRIRNGEPAPGFVLTATDVSGNAVWQSPIGTGITKVLNVPFNAFSPTRSSFGWTDAGGNGRRPSNIISGLCTFQAPLLLPVGSIITRIEWLFIDHEEQKDFTFRFLERAEYRTISPGSGVSVVSNVKSSGVSIEPRMVSASINNYVLDNTLYYLDVSLEDWPTAIATMGIFGARIHYK